MIDVRGTSHIASSDLAAIRERVREQQPSVVALELDRTRLAALLGEVEERRSLRNPFVQLLRFAQSLMGRKTGAMPGSDMLAAFQAAEEQGITVALVDRPIGETLRRLREEVSLLEKIKFVGFLLVGWAVLPLAEFDATEVPDADTVDMMLLQFEVSFPGMYAVLVAERNEIMAARLRELERVHGDVLAFVGAGHVQGVRELLAEHS